MPPSSAPPDDAAPRTVPFAGLRRNARALAGGALLLVALALLPDLTPAIAPSIALVSIRLAFVGALNGVRSPSAMSRDGRLWRGPPPSTLDDRDAPDPVHVPGVVAEGYSDTGDVFRVLGRRVGIEVRSLSLSLSLSLTRGSRSSELLAVETPDGYGDEEDGKD